jgi:hypothetical protein
MGLFRAKPQRLRKGDMHGVDGNWVRFRITCPKDPLRYLCAVSALRETAVSFRLFCFQITQSPSCDSANVISQDANRLRPEHVLAPKQGFRSRAIRELLLGFPH